MNKIHIDILLISIVSLFIGCSRRERVPSDEEEAIYNLVGDPCAKGDYSTAIARADSILVAPREMSDSLRAFIMIDRDVSILEQGNLDWAIAYADTVIDFGSKYDVPTAVMQGLQHKGIVCRRKGDYDNAISFYKNGLEMAIDCKDADMQQVFSEMLAIACTERGLYSEAESFGLRSLDLSRKSGDNIGELNAISTLGGIMAKAGKYKEAVDVLIPYHDAVSHERTLLRVKYLTPLLHSYLSLDSLTKVHELLSETYEVLSEVPRGSQAYLVAVNTEAALAEKEGRYSDQWRWFHIADSIGGMGTAPEIWFSQRAECLANLGRYKEAYGMEREAFSALDSIRTLDMDSRLAELSVKYNTLDKENAIVRLKAQRLTAGIIALICIMIVIIGIFLFLTTRRRALRRLEKERQEEYIKGLEEERGRMARELHDDIAGSLVGLQWQLPSMGQEDTAKNILNIARRVRSLSHELMPPRFEEETFTSILINFVAKINSSSGKHVVLTDEGSFDWDSVTPVECRELYRMVQESVGNAMRHGADGDIRLILSGSTNFRLSVVNKIPGDASFDESENEGIGLRTLKARASIIGAQISILRADGFFNITIFQP